MNQRKLYQWLLASAVTLFSGSASGFADTPLTDPDSVTEEKLSLTGFRSGPFQLQSWKLTGGFEGIYFEDATNKDVLSAFNLQAEFDSQLSSSVTFDASVAGIFEQGTSQGLEGQSTRRDSGFYLNQSRLKYSVTRWMHLEAGALNQTQYRSELIAGSTSYPAFRQNFQWKAGDWSFQGTFQQAIPTSHKLSAKAVEKEALPSYLSSGLSISKSFPFGTVVRVVPGLYSFQNIPSEVAFESCQRGNTPSNERCTPSSEFAHSFNGIDLYSDIRFQLPHDWLIQPHLNYLQNLSAPDGKAQAYQAKLQFHKGIDTDMAVSWSAFYFEKQSDVTPSFYSPFLLENNRRGFGGELALEMFRRSVRLSASYLQTEPLRVTAFQNSTVQFINLNLETFYDAL